MKERDLDSLADIEEANALGAVELVAAGAQHVDVQVVHVDRNMAKCLYRIRVEENAMLFGDLSDLCHRLNGSDLVVCKHDGDENGIRADRLFLTPQGLTTPFSSTSR